MADDEEFHDPEADRSDEEENQDESGHSGANNNDGQSSNNKSMNGNRSAYRQKYKRAWELDKDLKDWVRACPSDAYAAFCIFCRSKLHAHKKGLLAHGKSAKHEKNTPANPSDALHLMQIGEHEGMSNDDGFQQDSFRYKSFRPPGAPKNYKLFNMSWLEDKRFKPWLRSVPSNRTKALCIACRSVITAGFSELIKHSRAAKHIKAGEGPFEEVSEEDLQWLESCQPLKTERESMYSAPIIYDDKPGLFFKDIVERLTKHLPLELAEKWDKVGVLCEPLQPVKVHHILLTIDLTEEVVEEAIRKRSQFIISYHPPIFNPIERIVMSCWKNRVLAMCMRNEIGVYSPHTALDAVKGGVNDWLVSPFLTSDEDKIEPIQPKDANCYEVVVTAPETVVQHQVVQGDQVVATDQATGATMVPVETAGGDQAMIPAEEAQHHYAPITGLGMGRLIRLSTPLPLYEVIERTKSHLGVKHLRLALHRKHNRTTKINTIAVCAGSGLSVLKGCQADVWITGEMPHHDVLNAKNNGITVLAGEHSNTERGFLRDWSQQLKSSVFEDKVLVTVSELDEDPYQIV